MHKKKILKSRKLALTEKCIYLLGLGWLATVAFPALAPSFTTFVGGIIGLLATYHGANVTQSVFAPDTEKLKTVISEEKEEIPNLPHI